LLRTNNDVLAGGHLLTKVMLLLFMRPALPDAAAVTANAPAAAVLDKPGAALDAAALAVVTLLLLRLVLHSLRLLLSQCS
jgi:hypothetical protein